MMLQDSVSCSSFLTGLKIDLSSASDSVEAEAVGYKDYHIHIYSNSWGPNDFGFVVDGPGTLLARTFSNGASEVSISAGNQSLGMNTFILS